MPMTALVLAFALPSFDTIGKLAIFLFTLSVLIVMHEGGHFLVARWNGVRVNDFAVGFGPTVLKWTSKRTGTNYRLNILPIGGYCAMQGEDGVTSEAEQQRQFRAESGLASAGSSGGVAVLERPPVVAASPAPAAPAAPGADNFQSKKPWQRLSIVLAGPVANFILAFFIVFASALIFGVATSTISPEIGPILSNSPAQKAGLQMGDRIVAIDGTPYTSGKDVVNKIRASANVKLQLTIDRQGNRFVVPIVPAVKKDDKGKTIGQIGFSVVPTLQRVGPVEAFRGAAETFGLMATSYASYLSVLPQHLGSVHGVIGMGQAAAQVQDLGWAQYFMLAAQISIGLGVLNLLPFPALDGGRGIFIIAEMLRGRPVDAEKEALVHVTGFAVLMVLMVFVAFHDILNIVNGKSVFD